MQKKKSVTKYQSFIGGLTEGYNYPKGKKILLRDLLEMKDVLIVDRGYFLENKKLIESWAQKRH